MNAVAMNAEQEREAVKQRLFFIEQALKRDPDRSYRRELVREFLDLTDPHSPKEPDL